MNYTTDEVMQFIREEDVKFVRMAFCDIYGRQHNVAIMAGELQRAFEHGIAFDASAISGFDMEVRSDLFLRPDAATLTELPWRPQHGRGARMMCDIVYPDGKPFEGDSRRVLKQAVEHASNSGLKFLFGTEMEFYLFRLDESGNPTREPFDQAGYMDVAPDDKGENIRREICLTLERMGITPESSHHESGPGQNEIDFRYADPLSAADYAITFRSAVKTIAGLNGLCADFSPRPLKHHDGNGMHINFSAKCGEEEISPLKLVPGLMEKVREMTVFLNPGEESYDRLGRDKAPGWITWSRENRSQLIRVPAASGPFRRVELRSPDSLSNPYLDFALIIHACMFGLEKDLPLADPADFNTFSAGAEKMSSYQKLPVSLTEAAAFAWESRFIRDYIPELILKGYCRK